MSNPANDNRAPHPIPGVTIRPDGGMTFDGPEAMTFYRSVVTAAAMRLELNTGMKIRRGPSIFARIKRELGVKGNRLAVYLAYCERHNLDPRL